MSTDHSQRFVLTGSINTFNGHYEAFKPPRVVEHLPQDPRLEYTYYVESGGFDYLLCPICFPNSHKVEDNRRAPGA